MTATLPFLIPIRAIDAVSGPMGRIRSALGGTRLMGALKGLTGGLGTMFTWTKRVALGFGAMAAAAAAGLIAIAARTASQGDAVAKLAKKLGIGVEALQEFQFVAERSGVSTDTFNQSMVAFTKRLGEAKAGTGSLASFLKRVSPAMLEQVTSAGSVEEALTLYLDAVGKIEDPTKRAALASAAFSRAGVGMVNVAAEGRDGIEKLRARIRELGGVMGSEAAADSEEFQDALFDLKTGFRGLTQTIGTAVIPHLTTLMRRIAELWVQHLPAVRIAVARAGAWMVRAFEWGKQAGVALVGVYRDGMAWLAPYVEMVGGWGKVLEFAAFVVGGVLVAGFIALAAAALSAAIPIITAFAPFLIVGAIIGALAYVIWTFWDEIVAGAKMAWEWMTNLAGDFWDWLTDRVSAFLDWMPDLSSLVPDWVRDLVGGDDKKVTFHSQKSQLITRTGEALEDRRVLDQTARVKIEMPNLPAGARVTTDKPAAMGLDLDTGFASPAFGGGV